MNVKSRIQDMLPFVIVVTFVAAFAVFVISTQVLANPVTVPPRQELPPATNPTR